MWSEGTIGVPASVAGKPTAVHYWVKHYKEPSKYGINNGRISKVMLKIDEEIVCNYDRGWDGNTDTNLLLNSFRSALGINPKRMVLTVPSGWAEK